MEEYRADLIPLIQHLVEGLKPFASANAVNLNFISNESVMLVRYDPERIIPSLTKLICRIIVYTSRNHAVSVIVPRGQNPRNGKVRIQIRNNSSDLDHICESLSIGIELSFYIIPLSRSCTMFYIDIPIFEGDMKIESGKHRPESRAYPKYDLHFLKELPSISSPNYYSKYQQDKYYSPCAGNILT